MKTITKKKKPCCMKNPFVPSKYTILDIQKETPNDITLTIDMKINHDPGQFVQVSLPGIGEAPISICSDSREFIKLNVHQVGNVTRLLGTLKKGDSIFIRGPYGKGYPMKILKGNNLILVAGGCGIAPLKGVIDYIENHRNEYKDIHVFTGFRSEQDIIFKQDLDLWRQKYNVALAINQKPEGLFCYTATEGYITDQLQSAPIDNTNKVVFICGPPPMMKIVIDILLKKGFHEDQIFISAERLMYCAIGICCHCMIRGKYTCVDGPVFRYDEVKAMQNE